jgi:hypothetical protein
MQNNEDQNWRKLFAIKWRKSQFLTSLVYESIYNKYISIESQIYSERDAIIYV